MTYGSRLGAKRSIRGPLGIGARITGALGALVLGLIVAVSLGANPSPASAATLPIAVNQCNDSVADNASAHAVACDVTVTNNLNIATGETSSVTVTTACDGSANTLPLACVKTTTPSTALVLSVTQCNGSVNAGGSNLVCTVRVTNNIVGTAPTTPATVNQCVGSGAGGGTQPTLNCDPADAHTVGATIVQCNGSGNNGGGSNRVICDVSPSTQVAALRVMVNQCNGSSNGGGSTVTCSVLERNLVTAAAVTPPSTTPPTTPPTTAPPTAAPPTTAPGTSTGTGAATPTVIPTPSSAASATPSPIAGTTESDTLAYTGADLTPAALIGALAMLLGAGIILLRNRRLTKRAGVDAVRRR